MSSPGQQSREKERERERNMDRDLRQRAARTETTGRADWVAGGCWYGSGYEGLTSCERRDVGRRCKSTNLRAQLIHCSCRCPNAPAVLAINRIRVGDWDEWMHQDRSRTPPSLSLSRSLALSLSQLVVHSLPFLFRLRPSVPPTHAPSSTTFFPHHNHNRSCEQDDCHHSTADLTLSSSIPCLRLHSKRGARPKKKTPPPAA
ncbi:hypothetical protein IWX50DRAFT_648642, partial [Phyllosticta citricarpa]